MGGEGCGYSLDVYFTLSSSRERGGKGQTTLHRPTLLFLGELLSL